LTEDYRDTIHADTAAGIETPREAFLRKWRLKCRVVADSLEEAGDRLFTFTRRDPSQWKSARTTNAIKPLNGELRRRIKTQTVLPCAKTVPMLLWTLLASGQIQTRKVDGCETLSQPIEPMPLDLAARETGASHARRPPPGNFHQLHDTT
jgi:transposase-like protein